MCRKIFLLILWILSPFLVLGNAPTPVLRLSSSFSVNTVACDLPAPTNFQVTAIGTTWVTLVWVPTAGGVNHHVQIFRSSDGLLVGDAVIPPNMAQTVTFNGLVSGETYHATACAVCPDGIDSQNKATITGIDTLITDLIVSGVIGNEGPPTCTINGFGEYCHFTLNGSTTDFRIQRSNGAVPKAFTVQKLTNPKPKIRVHSGVSSPLEPYVFFIDGNQGGVNPIEGKVIHIKVNDLTVASFDLYEQNSMGRLRWIGGDSINFVIVRITPPPTGLPNPPSRYIRQRDESSTETQALPATASPNPFSEVLDVFPGNPSAENIHLQLFNLSGQRVLDRQFAGGQEQYSLPTAGLSHGFYLLRIEADGVVQTLKVVKSE